MKLQQSKELYNTACDYLVAGVNSPVRSFAAVGGNPIFIKQATADQIIDVDQNQYLDFVLAYGPMILGHGDQEVNQAIVAALTNGYAYGTSSAAEIDLAKLILSHFPQHHKIRFVNSGTEAVFSAIRLARAATKRNKIIKFVGCYHGHADSLLVAAGSGIATLSMPGSLGVPDGAVVDTLIADYNNLEQVKQHFVNYPQDIAAIIIEPIAGNMGVVLPQANFLASLKELTQQHGALLIIDEVMTGYRSCLGGAQNRLGVTADITCLGKIIGGGMPIGAYLARQEIMDNVAPLGGMYQAGTFSGNPIAMAAGIATLNKLAELNPYQQFDHWTSELATAITTIAAQHGITVTVNHFGSMFNPFFTDQAVVDFKSATTSNNEIFKDFFWLMLEKGYFIPPSQYESWFLSSLFNQDKFNKFQMDLEQIFTIIGNNHKK